MLHLIFYRVNRADESVQTENNFSRSQANAFNSIFLSNETSGQKRQTKLLIRIIKFKTNLFFFLRVRVLIGFGELNENFPRKKDIGNNILKRGEKIQNNKKKKMPQKGMQFHG